jgi:copper resistance protein C
LLQHHERGNIVKKLLFLFICTLVMLPTIASAHTELTSSNPAKGQVVTEDLTEILLTFAGKIESLSTMKLMRDGQEIPLHVDLQEKQMKSTLSNPLENGSYTIDWRIAGEDGHLITGEIPFTVQKEQSVEHEHKPEVNEPNTTDTEKSKAETQSKNDEPSTNSIKIIISAVIVLILGVGMFFLFGRKK